MSAASQNQPPIFKIVSPELAMEEAGIRQHKIKYTTTLRLKNVQDLTCRQISESILKSIKSKLEDRGVGGVCKNAITAGNEEDEIFLDDTPRLISDSRVNVGQCYVQLDQQDTGNYRDAYVAWFDQDEHLGNVLVETLNEMDNF